MIKKYFIHNKINILIILIYLMLPFIFFKGSFNLNSIILGMRDAQVGFFPALDLKIQIIKNLEMPFWDRYIFSGYPMLSTPSDSALYPINLILGLIFPVTAAYNLSVLVHYSLAGIFIYIFMRQYNLNKMACFTSGFIFMFSGMMITHRDHITRLYTIIWIPLILLLLEKYRKSKKIEFVLLASIPYSVSFFAGDPQMFLYGSIVILFFILYYSLIYEGVKNFYFLSSLSVFLLGVLIISVQLIPSIIMMQNSYRNEISYTFFSDFSYSPKLLPTLFIPFFFGRGSYMIENVPKYFSVWNAGEMIKYFGISTIPLLILGIFKKNKHKYLWLFIMVFSFILVLGRHTPFYRLMYEMPLYNKFRVPARNWFEFGLSFSIIAGFGFDYLFKNNGKIKKILTGGAAFISVILAGFLVFFTIFKNALEVVKESFTFLSDNEIKLLYENLKLSNYSVYASLTIMIITIILFTILIFKRNKILLFFLIAFVFLDLFSWGHFMDRPRDITYVSSNLEESEEFKFLSDDNEMFRIYPQTTETGEFKFYPNMNIHYSLESIMGHDPILLKSYGSITRFPQDPGYGIDEIALLRNNIIISMLNTKYIFLEHHKDLEGLMEEIEKSYYIDSRVVFKFDENIKKTTVYNKNFTTYGELTLTDTKRNLEVFKFPVDIYANKKYMVSFYIKGDDTLKDVVHFDLYGEGYDNIEQEFYLDLNDIGTEYKKINRVIETEYIPDLKNIFFRIYTNSEGNFLIKDLEIIEVEINKERNYEYVPGSNDYIILKNLKYLPRFYFVNKVLEIDDIKTARDILWEENESGYKDEFEPSETALVENYNNDNKFFKQCEKNVEIVYYKNNSVKLNVFTEDDAFMVFSDNYYPGWSAFIDKEKTDVYRVNGILKGIIIPADSHEIIFKYRPPFFIITGTISALSLFSIVLFSILLYYRKRRKKIS
jgi:hypothetical protein